MIVLSLRTFYDHTLFELYLCLIDVGKMRVQIDKKLNKMNVKGLV